MCVAAVAFNINLTYPFVLIHNRDEFLSRPAAGLETDAKGVAGGKDLQSGGRWLGVVNNARKRGFAFVTNHRMVPKHPQYGDKSRGHIVSAYLEGDEPLPQFSRSLEDSLLKYQPFNFIAGDFEKLYFLNSVTLSSGEISEGVFAVSNGDPLQLWPKSSRLAGGLKNILSSGLDEKRMVQNAFLLLADTQKAPDEELPQTGVAPDLEKNLSSIFVDLPNYGTRASTIVLRDAAGLIKIWERVFVRGRKSETSQILL